MTINEVVESKKIDFSDIPASYYLIGLLSAFENRFQALADSQMKEISWKQFFLIICISRCEQAPTINELSEIVGSSHQNVKQLLLKLQTKDFVELYVDETDRRKQRVKLTKHCKDFCEQNDAMSTNVMNEMFEGISDDDLLTTIKTISLIEANLSNIK